MSAACVCGEINTRHCPVHGQGESAAMTDEEAQYAAEYAAMAKEHDPERDAFVRASSAPPRGFLIGGRLHIPRETVTISGEPGYGGASRSLCGKLEGIVYSAEVARFHYPDMPVCLWCEGRAARGT